jgi:tRNA nucleotidyltransferase (CCA-adding enzyme)
MMRISACAAAARHWRLLKAETPVRLHCEAPDAELLLVDWLNALVYATATRNTLFARFKVSIHNHRLDATAWGEPIDAERHQPAAEVKGATYTALKVVREADGSWCAQCVVDV